MSYNPTNYTAIHGLMQLLRYQNNYPALGTASLILAEQAHNLLGDKIPPIMEEYTALFQFNLFGDYPYKVDVVPSAIFAAVFGVIAILHLTIFSINYSRQHYFWISLGWVFYSIMRFLGWVLRIEWSKDLSNTRLAVAAEVFLVLPSIVLVSINLILAARIFTWRHPVGGSRRLFWNTMFAVYAAVLAVIAMTIVCAACPYLYFLSLENYRRFQRGVQASAVLIILYSLTAVTLLLLAYFFPTTKKDDHFYTYQPWWIESFSPFYFVAKGAKEAAEESFMKRVSNHRHAVRVIAATHHHYNTVQGLTTQRGSLKHNVSLMIIVTTTVLIFAASVLRGILMFQGRFAMNASAIGKPVVMYMFWGFSEVFINALYIVGRVDLRFYRPDRLPKKVRNIITAEQSINVTPDDLSFVSSHHDEKRYTLGSDTDSRDTHDVMSGESSNLGFDFDVHSDNTDRSTLSYHEEFKF